MTYSTPRLASLPHVLATAIVIGSVTMAPGRTVAAAFRTVALSGQPAPGGPGGVNYSNFPNAPVLNESGQTAFIGGITGPGVTSANNLGVWSEGAGSLALVARKGDQAAGASVAENFSSFNALTLNDAGETAFTGSLAGWSVTSSNDSGSWSEGSGSLALLAREGSQAAGMPAGATYRSFADISTGPSLNDAGASSFFATVTGGGVTSTNDSGIWLGEVGALTLLARTGTPAPGAPAGVNYGGFFEPKPINNAGQTAFFAFLTGTGVTTSNNAGLWSGGPGSLALKARTGSQAPGVADGVNFAGLTSPALNGGGKIAFRGTLAGAAVTSANDSGIWSEGSGSVALVAREGNQAPGAPSGAHFFSFDPPVFNDAGHTAFTASLTGGGVSPGSNQGIWLEQSGNLALVARTGAQAPGAPAGANFNSFSFRRSMNSPALNDAGQVAFLGFLAGEAVTSNNDLGLWATDVAGTLRLVFRKGDALKVAPGDFRTVSGLGFAYNTGNGDGRASGFNDRGQIAFRASFTDGSQGLFVTTVVPEPSALAMFSLAITGICWRSRFTDRRHQAACPLAGVPYCRPFC